MSQPNSSLILAFDWIGSALSTAYFLTPLYQIFYLYKGKLHVKQIPLTLLITILINCLLWVLFSIFRPEIWVQMILTNSIGLLFNGIILFLYLYLLCDKNPWKFIGYGLFVLNLLVEIGYIMYVSFIKDAVDIDSRLGVDYLGWVGMFVNVIMYASPALNIIDLFQTRQTQFMPILTNVIGFFSALTWLFYGFLKDEPRTMISNAVSLLVLIVQIAIWFYFYYITAKKMQPVSIANVDKMPFTDE